MQQTKSIIDMTKLTKQEILVLARAGRKSVKHAKTPQVPVPGWTDIFDIDTPEAAE